jgi:methionyl aminopeptidase
MIVLKSRHEIELMRQAGHIVGMVLAEMRNVVRPGITTKELDTIAERIIVKAGAKPAFKGYAGFPATICASINEEIVHGIPSKRRVLKEGDIISVDVGSIYKGWYGDAAITLPVGKVSKEAERLLEVTKGSLEAAIAKAVPGNYLGDISATVQQYVESRGFSVIREYTGHGIGRELHEEPQVLNYGNPGTGVRLRPGMTMAIEPMVSAGSYKTRVLRDGWTVVTQDGSLTAHFEHTIAITDNGTEILTKYD